MDDGVPGRADGVRTTGGGVLKPVKPGTTGTTPMPPGPGCRTGSGPGRDAGAGADALAVDDWEAAVIRAVPSLRTITISSNADAIWQAFAVLLPVRTVGVMGDGRTYENVCALRAVTSTDGMTADIYPFDAAFLSRCATRIINEVKGINRVVYDYTSKPPGTIEWE